MSKIRSEADKACVLDSKCGTKHYIMQRVTAIALLPLSVWFVVSAILLLQAPLYRIPVFVMSPFNLTASILFILAFLYHGALGMQTIIEDYVHCKAIKYSLLVGIYFMSIISAIAGVCGIFGMHIFFMIKMAG